MIHSSATVPVNQEGETKLTREQVWKGLELKARDARLFLPPGLCTRCDVIEESATHFVRTATIAAPTSGKSSPLSHRARSPSSRQPAPVKAPFSMSCSRTKPAHCS